MVTKSASSEIVKYGCFRLNRGKFFRPQDYATMAAIHLGREGTGSLTIGTKRQATMTCAPARERTIIGRLYSSPCAGEQLRRVLAGGRFVFEFLADARGAGSRDRVWYAYLIRCILTLEAGRFHCLASGTRLCMVSFRRAPCSSVFETSLFGLGLRGMWGRPGSIFVKNSLLSNVV